MGFGTYREFFAYQAKRKSVARSWFSSPVGGLMELVYVQENDEAFRTLVRPGGVLISQPAKADVFGETGPFRSWANRLGRLSKRKQDHAIQ